MRGRVAPHVIERRTGWPAGAGLVMLGLAVVSGAWGCAQPVADAGSGQVDLRAYWLEVAVLLGAGGALLRCWRRGVFVDRAGDTVSHWWGIGFLGRRRVLRLGPTRALSAFTGVRAVRSNATEHYKRFRRPTYHVQLEAGASLGGQLALRQRFIVDDEIARADEARGSGERLAAYLDLELIDQTADGPGTERSTSQP